MGNLEKEGQRGMCVAGRTSGRFLSEESRLIWWKLK